MVNKDITMHVATWKHFFHDFNLILKRHEKMFPLYYTYGDAQIQIIRSHASEEESLLQDLLGILKSKLQSHRSM